MENHKYRPDFENPEVWTLGDRWYLEPFSTNPGGLVTVLKNMPPELVGALCSRASRASQSLLRVFLEEYIYPIVNGKDKGLAEELDRTVNFLHAHGFKKILNNQRAQAFYSKWLAQYGDDSIAQVTGTHLVFWGISQVAMKFLEDSRIGLAPIEKSTRFVNFGKKINGKYLYYRDPDMIDSPLGEEYVRVMDMLFDTYILAVEKLKVWLASRFPDEKPSVVEKKAFDVARGFLPMSTLGQVAFYGNAQAFEYSINKCQKQNLGELRWIADSARKELTEEIGSLLLRLDDDKTHKYQEYLASRRDKVVAERNRLIDEKQLIGWCFPGRTEVHLVDFNQDGEADIVAGILFSYSSFTWDDLKRSAKEMSADDKRKVIAAYLEGRNARWQKVGRAFENAYLRFEIVMNAGAYRDLHRHRMLTQERQLFTVFHGYDVPPEIEEAGLSPLLHHALEEVGQLHENISKTLSQEHAQYATTLFHRIRFYQFTNVRELFWECELRTTSQGHPDYRKIEQEKFRLFKEKYPLIAEFMLIDMHEYDFARRGTEERIQKKEEELKNKLKGS